MYTPGTILRLAREERKLSISDVKQFAKIRESAIIAMETDEFERFPAAYMQTFLPSYADFLGVPQYKLAEAFKATLPEYGYLARSLYSRTLQQIAFAQMQLELAHANPTLFMQAGAFAKTYSARLVVVMVACVLGWFAMTSDVSLIGTLFVNRFVSTPNEMRGTPFTEISDPVAAESGSVAARAGSQAAEEQPMETIHLASLLNVTVNTEAIKAIAFKQTEVLSHSAGTALVKAVDEIAPPEPMHVSFDASRRSISSIAATMLAQAPRPQEVPVEVGMPHTITEAAIEQNSARGGAGNGHILVAGVENDPINVPMNVASLRRVRAKARILALTASLGKRMYHAPEVEAVVLKMIPIEPVQMIIPAMQPSVEYRLRQAAERILVPIIIPASDRALTPVESADESIK